MIIINKDDTSFVNYEQIENVFIGDTSIKANLKSGKGMQLAKYNTIEDTKEAFKILIDRLRQNQLIVKMPTDEEVKTKIQLTKDYIPRSLTGKKQKSHGGS